MRKLKSTMILAGEQDAFMAPGTRIQSRKVTQSRQGTGDLVHNDVHIVLILVTPLGSCRQRSRSSRIFLSECRLEGFIHLDFDTSFG